MTSERQVLGRGLDQLLGRVETSSILENKRGLDNRVLQVGIERVHPNPQQPRTHFDPHALKELAHSIKEQGLIQPIVVSQKQNGDFIIIAGERRWRAVQQLGWNRIPVIVKSDEGKREKRTVLALVENLQRQDLNPIEEAQAFSWLLNEKGWLQKDLADRIGRDRSTIANTLRLLQLHPFAQKLLVQNKISLSIAKLLLQEKSQEKQKIWARQACYEKWTVKDLEKKIKAQNYKAPTSAPQHEWPSWLEEGCRKLARKWSLDITLKASSKQSKVIISFSDPQQLKDFIDHV